MLDIKQLKYFIEVVENCDSLKGEFSGFSLIEQLQKYSRNTKLEITENKLNKSIDETLTYLEFVTDSLSRLPYNEINNTDVILRYLEEYNSSIDEIESLSISNPKLETLLCEFYTQQENSFLKQKAFFIQRQLVDYFKSKYILELLHQCESSNTNYKVKTKYNKKIFKNLQEQYWFENIIEDNNFFDENKKVNRKGFQAICDAIFRNSDCKESIFKTNIKLKDYIAFLRVTYSAKIKSDKSLSDGYKYELIVKNGIIEFKENKAQ